MNETVISREKNFARGSKYAWKWLYSVALPGAEPVAIGTLKAEAVSWAKARSKAPIVFAWEKR